jgi:hypothetical protein
MLHAASLKVQKAIRVKRGSVGVSIKSARKFYRFFYKYFILILIHFILEMTLNIIFSVVGKNKVGK